MLSLGSRWQHLTRKEATATQTEANVYLSAIFTLCCVGILQQGVVSEAQQPLRLAEEGN